MASTSADLTNTPRETMEYDVVIVGAGPAGLSCAIHIKQLAQKNQQDISVCVLEKGSEVGAHIMSGAIMDMRAMNELLPDWKNQGAPINTPVAQDEFWFLTTQKHYTVPHNLLPKCFDNQGNYIISLGNVVRWLGEQAEKLGVEIFPGFTASEILYNEKNTVIGILTGDMGVNKEGQPTNNYQPGVEIHAKYTLFAEGARGHLGRKLTEKFNLDGHALAQSYGLGIKEIWQIDPAKHVPGKVIHAAGWPLAHDTYGGAFIYHAANSQLYIGLIVGLDYKNPYLSPFEEFQRFKTHPSIRPMLEGAKRISYGARAIAAGGLSALPKLTFPGGALIGCDAGFLNAARIKGSHAAIKSGMLAAESVFHKLSNFQMHDELSCYQTRFENSWLYSELNEARNFKQWFKYGLGVASLMTGIEQLVLRGKMPWTLHKNIPDYACLEPAHRFDKIHYPKPDGKLTFDRLSSVYLANLSHDENQPIHLTLKNNETPVNTNLAEYAGPEQRYCPAGVYEFVKDTKSQNAQDQYKLQINAQNCVHCKTCDIKDPSQNIVWVTPEGGSGPNYSGM